MACNLFVLRLSRRCRGFGGTTSAPHLITIYRFFLVAITRVHGIVRFRIGGDGYERPQ